MSQPYRTTQLERVNAVGSDEEDLLELLKDQLDALGTRYHKQPKASEGFRVRAADVRGRTLWMRVNKGPEGVPGETYDLDTDTSTETTERIALLSGLRALIALPIDSYYGLLFVERIGIRHLKETLSDQLIEPAKSRSARMIRTESFAELKDWETYLSGYRAVRISEVLSRRSTDEDASTVEDTTVRIVADGQGVQGTTNTVFSLIADKFKRRDDRVAALIRVSSLADQRVADEESGVAFQDEAEYQSALKDLRAIEAGHSNGREFEGVIDDVVAVDREGYQHKSFSVEVGPPGSRTGRPISIEGDHMPQFVYVTNARLTDRGLRDLWVAHAESILKKRGVHLPVGWAT